MQLKVKLADGVPTPRHAREGDAGMDLTARESVSIPPNGIVMVGTGVRAAIPEGYFGDVRPRSGMASKRGVTIANTPGVIDSNYRGEIMLPLYNLDMWRSARVEAGERVAQMLILKHETVECVEVDELDDTERGEGGFGSTGSTTLVDENGEVVG